MDKNNNKRTLLEKLRYKYRLIVINEDTFEQKASVRLSRFNIYAGVSILSILLIVVTTAFIAYTPLKYYMPGVGNIDIRSKLANLEFESDSLTKELDQRNFWISNVQKIVSGDLDSSYYKSDSIQKIDVTNIDLNNVTEEEQKLRDEMEAAENANLQDGAINNGGITMSQSNNFLSNLIPPAEGYVTADYNRNDFHYGIDIAGKEEAPVVAIARGTVIVSEWNPETGNVVAVQHPNNVISFYKHNAALLKKVGNFVEQGEAIAVMGNSGELSTGPHLHFELWHNGVALEPLEYFILEKIN